MGQKKGFIMAQEDKQKAVIYCRTACVKQNDNSKLILQEENCRHYAEAQGYEVIKAFHDEALSGNDLNRLGIKALLDCLREVSNQKPVVIIEDISRLARSLGLCAQLMKAIQDVDGKLHSLGFVSH